MKPAGDWNSSELVFARIHTYSKLEIVRVGNCQNWKFSELEIFRIGNCQNQKLSELDIVRIRICQNWNLSEFEFPISNSENFLTVAKNRF